MHKKYTLLWVLFCIGSIVGKAQTATDAGAPKKSCTCGFSSINQFGLITGEKTPAVTVQTINGFRYKTWFAGVGIGMDNYMHTSFPLFLDVRKNLLNKPGSPFVYADAGYHLFGDDLRKYNEYVITGYDMNGVYYDMGFGYKIRIRSKQAFLLSAGYSVKKLSRKEYTGISGDIVCITWPCGGYVNTYQYRLNRLSFKVGFQL